MGTLKKRATGLVVALAFLLSLGAFGLTSSAEAGFFSQWKFQQLTATQGNSEEISENDQPTQSFVKSGNHRKKLKKFRRFLRHLLAKIASAHQ